LQQQFIISPAHGGQLDLSRQTEEKKKKKRVSRSCMAHRILSLGRLAAITIFFF
jgi:hypothetical protein